MNQSLKTPENNAAAIPRVCPKCNEITNTSATECPKCGKKLMPVSRIKMLGWLSLACGLFLFGLMSWLSIWMYQAITQSGQPGATTTFRGGPEVVGFIILIFGLVLTFAVFAIASGLWQIIFGRRNKILTVIVIILGIVFVGIGLMTSFSKY